MNFFPKSNLKGSVSAQKCCGSATLFNCNACKMMNIYFFNQYLRKSVQIGLNLHDCWITFSPYFCEISFGLRLLSFWFGSISSWQSSTKPKIDNEGRWGKLGSVCGILESTNIYNLQRTLLQWLSLNVVLLCSHQRRQKVEGHAAKVWKSSQCKASFSKG